MDMRGYPRRLAVGREPHCLVVVQRAHFCEERNGLSTQRKRFPLHEKGVRALHKVLKNLHNSALDASACSISRHRDEANGKGAS